MLLPAAAAVDDAGAPAAAGGASARSEEGIYNSSIFDESRVRVVNATYESMRCECGAWPDEDAIREESRALELSTLVFYTHYCTEVLSRARETGPDP